jgi:hypothetical protein
MSTDSFHYRGALRHDAAMGRLGGQGERELPQAQQQQAQQRQPL